MLITESFTFPQQAWTQHADMMPKLIALDVDGTLLHARRHISQEHQELIAELRQQGIAICLVTGRPHLTTLWPHQELALDTPLVCFNGVWIGECDGTEWQSHPLDAAAVAEITAITEHLPGSTCVYPSTETWWMNRTCDITADWPQRYQVPITLGGPMPAGGSFKVMFVSDPQVVERIVPQLRLQFGDRYHIVASEADRVEIHQPFATKAFGLAQLAQGMGIEQHAVWAVGDGLNDIEMLEWAGTGFAMGQAAFAVQQAANHCLPSVHHHGLCGLRDYF